RRGIPQVSTTLRRSRRRAVVRGLPVRDHRAQAIDLLERESEHLAHFAEGRFSAIADDLADHRRAIAPVALVNFLDDLFAALVLEVDVDVRRLGALGGEE